MHRPVILIALALCFGLAMAPQACGAHALHEKDALRALLSEETLAAIESGKTVTQKNVVEKEGKRSAGSGAAVILVNGTPDAVWECLTDAEHLHEFMPRLVATEQYEEREDGIGIRYELKVAWKKVVYHLYERHDAEHHHLTWKMDERHKNDIKSTTGGWLLVPHNDDQTIVLYAVEADTGMPVPAFIENWLMNRDLPGIVEAVKLRVESGGTYQKD